MENYRENAGRVSRENRFVRACAIDTHMDSDISHESFCFEICKEIKTCRTLPIQYNLDKAPGLNLTPTVRTPQCGHTVWGKNIQYVQMGFDPNLGTKSGNRNAWKHAEP